jgi:hypothetical protein
MQLSICTGDGDIARADVEIASTHYKISTIRIHEICHPPDHDETFHF